MRENRRNGRPRWTALLLAAAVAASLLSGCGAAKSVNQDASSGTLSETSSSSSSAPQDDALPEFAPINPEQGSYDEAADALCEALRSSDPAALAALAQLPVEPFAPLASAVISETKALFSGERNEAGAEMYVVTLQLDQPGELPYAAGQQVFYAWLGSDARYGTGEEAVLQRLISGAIDEADTELRASDAVSTLEPLIAILGPQAFESWEALLADETFENGDHRVTEALLYLLRVLTPDGTSRDSFSEQEVQAAARDYLGLAAFDGTGTAFWDAERETYMTLGRGLPSRYDAYIGAGAAEDGSTEVRQLWFADSLLFIPESLYVYRQERNEAGGWRVLSGATMPAVASALPPAMQAGDYDAAAAALCEALRQSDAGALERLSLDVAVGAYDALATAKIAQVEAVRVDPLEAGIATYRITLDLEQPGALPYSAGEQAFYAQFCDGGSGKEGALLQRLIHTAFAGLFAQNQQVRKSGVTAAIDWVTGACARCPVFSGWEDFARQYGKEKLTGIVVDLTRYLLLDGADRFAFTAEEVRQAAALYLGLEEFDGSDTGLWDAENQRYDQRGWGMTNHYALYAGVEEGQDGRIDVNRWIFFDALYFLPQAVHQYQQTPNEDGSWKLLAARDITPAGPADGWPVASVS